jgi:hypothetical protein
MCGALWCVVLCDFGFHGSYAIGVVVFYQTPMENRSVYQIHLKCLLSFANDSSQLCFLSVFGALFLGVWHSWRSGSRCLVILTLYFFVLNTFGIMFVCVFHS